MSPITTNDYFGVFLMSPVFITIIGVLILPFSSHIAGIVVKIGLGLLIFVLLYFLFFYFFGKKVVYKSKRREVWLTEELKAIPHTRSYYFDLIELANTKGWNVKENGKTELQLKGSVSNLPFEVFAVYESVATDIKYIVDTISITVSVENGPKISITEGKLYGLLGENIIKGLGLKNITVTGEGNSGNKNFIVENKKEIQALMSPERHNVRVMTFEAGKLSVDLNSDADKNGDTCLGSIIDQLASIARNYNYAFNQNIIQR